MIAGTFIPPPTTATVILLHRVRYAAALGNRLWSGPDGEVASCFVWMSHKPDLQQYLPLPSPYPYIPLVNGITPFMSSDNGWFLSKTEKGCWNTNRNHYFRRGINESEGSVRVCFACDKKIDILFWKEAEAEAEQCTRVWQLVVLHIRIRCT